MASALAQKLIAAAVLVVAAWFLLKVVIGIVTGVAYVVAVVLAIVAIVWALRTL